MICKALPIYLVILVEICRCTLYGLDEAVLVEAVISSYRGVPEIGAGLVKKYGPFTCVDFPMTKQLLNIEYTDCFMGHVETNAAIILWLGGELDVNHRNFSLVLDQFLVGDMLASPETLSASGHAEALDIVAPYGYWDNWPSPAYFHVNSKRLAKILYSLNSPSLDVREEDRQSLANFRWYINNTYEIQSKWYLYEYMVTMIGSLHSFIMELASEHLPSEERARAFIRKLSTFNEKFISYKAHFNAAKKMRPPRFVISKVSSTVTRIISIIQSKPEGNPLMKNLKKQYEETIKAPMSTHVKNLAEKAISTNVVPTLKKFNNMLKSSMRNGDKTEKAGVWAHVHGLKFYQACVKRYTTSYSTASQLHELGIVEVAKLKRKIKGIITRLNKQGETLLSPNYPMEKNFNLLREQDDFYYSLDNKTVIVDSINNIITLIENKTKPYFKSWPDVILKISPVPKYLQSSLPSAYYHPPTANRNYGKFYINTGHPISKIGIRSLVCHEAVPGHHFQISRIVSNPTLKKLFNAQIRYSSTIEGWALYSEHLCAEYGVMTAYLDDQSPNTMYNMLGQLTGQIFRAARLVVDTGIHSKKWTREKARKFMQKNTALTTEKIRSEVDRYVSWPGQALSYYSGMMEIMALMEAVKEKQGEHFDIAEFHETILDQGSLPVAVMRQFVSEKYDLGLSVSDSIEMLADDG